MLSTSSPALGAFGVLRRADGDYSDTIFRCPKHPEARQYQSVRPPVPHEDAHAPYVSTHCYWCDAYGRMRGHTEFDRSAPQCHAYPIVSDPRSTEDPDAAP